MTIITECVDANQVNKISGYQNKQKASREQWRHWNAMYHDMGLNLIPALAYKKTPLVQFKSWQTERIDQEQWNEWSAKFGKPLACNMLLLTGARNGLVLVDADDEEAEALVQARCPETPLMVRTRKGWHRYYRHAGEGHYTKQIIGVVIGGQKYKLDIKGEGGYGVAPYSYRECGHCYEWDTEWTAELIASAPVYDPSWLPHEANRQSDESHSEFTGEGNSNEVRHADEVRSGLQEEGNLDTHDNRKKRAQSYLAATPGCQAGSEDVESKMLRLAAHLVHGFLLPRDTAVDLLMEYGQREDNRDADGRYYPWLRVGELRHKVDEALKYPARYSGVVGDKARVLHIETRLDDDKVHELVQAFDVPAMTPLAPVGDPDCEILDPTIDEERPRAKKAVVSGFKFKPMSAAEFSKAVFRVEWLVKRMLVRDQPAIIGGPKKALKTSTLVDLVLSLGSGLPFMGKFEVYKKCRTVMISGESGNHTLQETAHRVCKAKGIRLADTDTFWLDILPQLSVDEELEELQRGLAELKAEVVVIDPLYLCLLAGQGDKATNAGNLYDMGPLLLKVSRACLAAGCTPILAHHAKKNLQFKGGFEPLDLDDLSFSGVQEFARQWLLLSRRAPYTPGSGLHQLWFVAGGSCGQGGQWAVDIEEGQLNDDFSGRTWNVTVDDMPTVIKKKAEEKATKKMTEEELLTTEFLDKLDNLKEKMPRTKFREVVLGWNTTKYNRIEQRLLDTGAVVLMDHKFTVGNGSQRVGQIVMRRNMTDMTDEHD